VSGLNVPNRHASRPWPRRP